MAWVLNQCKSTPTHCMIAICITDNKVMLFITPYKIYFQNCWKPQVMMKLMEKGHKKLKILYLLLLLV
jgi:hypothetical protein